MGLLLFFYAVLLTAKATAGDSYLCVADMATGFIYNKTLEKWEINNLNTVDNKYRVKRSKEKEIAWEVQKIGKNIVSDFCKKDFNKNGNLECEGTDSFFMNKNNLRFILIFPYGYHNANMRNHQGALLFKEGDLTPFIEIGKCSSMP